MSRSCLNCGHETAEWVESCGRCQTLFTPIIGETVVERRIDEFHGLERVCIEIELPYHLINKKVRYVIEELF